LILAPWANLSQLTTANRQCPQCRLPLNSDHTTCAACGRSVSPRVVLEFQTRREFADALSRAVRMTQTPDHHLEFHGAFAEVAPERKPNIYPLVRILLEAGVPIGQLQSSALKSDCIITQFLCACNKPASGRQPEGWPALCGGVIVLSCIHIPPRKGCWVPGEGFELCIAH